MNRSEGRFVGKIRLTKTRTVRAYVDTGDGQIHCRVAGPAKGVAQRPPLLCLHMSPKSGWVYEKLIERLGADRLIVAPDTPGFGMSDRPSKRPSITDYADTLAGVAAHFAPDTAWDVLGYHTGAQIAVEMALRHEHRVRHLALISVPVLTPAERTAFRRMGLGRQRQWDEEGQTLLALWQLVLRWRTPGCDLAYCARSLADTLVAGEFGWWGHQAAFRHDMRSALTAVHHPVAIINPGDDLHQATRRAREVCPEATYVEKPDWAHGFIQKYPDEAAALISTLLDYP